MTPLEFAKAWTSTDSKLSPLSPDSLTGLNLKPSTFEFLTEAGLPFQAAPFLSFVQEKANAYNVIGKLTKYFDFLEASYDRYVVIGSSGEGDVIAIDTDENDQIVWLDHENYFSPRFFNSSINCLAECLTIYRDFIQDIVKENGESAYLDSNYSDEQLQVLIQKITTADRRAVNEDGFWKSDLEAMREDANH